ncbi:hypothetical protein EVAR_63925_1 [Eumeta japonica]|uniref:Uncharacterized protein n=1 Tax=Eumeta variegata TaxID=151549 RepID=A0A4C1ZNB9_EUMVA|nr:hypothetical protein EVAR_63925_1 [Eumeta japonica]
MLSGPTYMNEKQILERRGSGVSPFPKICEIYIFVIMSVKTNVEIREGLTYESRIASWTIHIGLNGDNTFGRLKFETDFQTVQYFPCFQIFYMSRPHSDFRLLGRRNRKSLKAIPTPRLGCKNTKLPDYPRTRARSRTLKTVSNRNHLT